MADDAEARITRLAAELESLPVDAREAFIETLSQDDRAAAWEAQLRLMDSETNLDDDEELGGEA
jgi:hypothetical protein